MLVLLQRGVSETVASEIATRLRMFGLSVHRTDHEGQVRLGADAHGLAVVSEVMDSQQVPLLARYADILQIGARNMQNYTLLREVGHCDKPVLLKRGLASTIEEWLMSAEHVISQGNASVILC